MHLLIMGPPGAGKGTQAEAVAKRLGIPTISTGQIFRDNIANATTLGQRAQPHVDSGGYVPDDITDAMLRDRLTQPDAQEGFLLDGYPRTLKQVETLDGILAEDGHEIERVIELTVDTEEVVQRLIRRGEQDGRSDDSADVIRRRLEVYYEQTAGLLEVYSNRGVLVRVDGMGEVTVVTEAILDALSGVGS